MTPALDASYASARALLSTYMLLPLERRLGFVTALRPDRQELAQIFAPAVVEGVEHGYRMLWGNAPVWPVPAVPQLEVFCATSNDLADATETARRFPGGYREITEWLRRDVMWAAWSVRSEGRHESSLFDGLVMIDAERWVWCPRPWKVLPRPPIETLYWWAD